VIASVSKTSHLAVDEKLDGGGSVVLEFGVHGLQRGPVGRLVRPALFDQHLGVGFSCLSAVWVPV